MYVSVVLVLETRSTCFVIGIDRPCPVWGMIDCGGYMHYTPYKEKHTYIGYFSVVQVTDKCTSYFVEASIQSSAEYS
jgi:hypothetical protein